MRTWLNATGESPVGPWAEDQQIVIGPFTEQERLDQFVERHGRVFRTNYTTVYSPDDYDAQVETQAMEGALDE